MFILALAPPLPIVSKFVVALTMLALVGTLIRARGSPFTWRSIAVAIGLSLVIVVVLEAALPSRFGGFHDLGLLAGIVGVACGAVFLRPVRSLPTRQWTAAALPWFLLACITGPLLGLLFAALAVLLTDVSPMDRALTFVSFVGIGTIAGVIGGLMVFSIQPRRTHKSLDMTDGGPQSPA